jgi:hypothetical protein
MNHIICFSGGHSSALVAIEVSRKYETENVILINHDISDSKEDADIKRFKKQIADYLGIEITYANIGGILDSSLLPDQFDVCVTAGALTDNAGNALCTSRLKTEPFNNYLSNNFKPYSDLFEERKECIIYYGFDMKEKARIQRRVGIMGAMGYKTEYVLALWPDRTIFSTNEIGIEPPSTYSVFEHANCKGCLKASLLHWYVTFVWYPEIYDKGIWMEEKIDFSIHTIIRDGVKRAIFLSELKPIFERMKIDEVPATEHQSKIKFAQLLRKYQIEEIDSKKPCECLI